MRCDVSLAGADTGSRTLNLPLTKRSLYHWSYTSVWQGMKDLNSHLTVLEAAVLPLHQSPIWRPRRDLNPQHPTWKDGALPVELFPRMVPRDGLEPPTLSV